MLVVGLLIIVQAINLSYNYFTAKAQLPAVFNIPAGQAAAVETKTAAPAESAADIQAQLQETMSKATNQAVANILPVETINKLLNAICWSIFATFLVYAGSKISEIGLKMIS